MTTATIYYRIQPKGLSLRHTSEDWSGEIFREHGRVCCYDSTDSLLAGEGDDWHRAPRLEVVEFTGRDPEELGGAHVPGISAVPIEIVRRTSLAKFLAALSRQQAKPASAGRVGLTYEAPEETPF